MAGRAAAYLNGMTSPRHQAEGFVKGGNIIDPGQVEFHLFGYIANSLFRDIIFEPLDILHDADDIRMPVLIFLQNLFNLVQIHILFLTGIFLPARHGLRSAQAMFYFLKHGTSAEIFEIIVYRR